MLDPSSSSSSTTTFDRRDHLSRIGRIGGLRLAALRDPRVTSAPGRLVARTRLEAKLLAEVDPNGLLPDAEREKRLARARKAHFINLSRKAAIARQKKGARP